MLLGRLVRENHDGGYWRIQGELLKLGFRVSASTTHQVLRALRITPAPERHTDTTWRRFLSIDVSRFQLLLKKWTLGNHRTIIITDRQHRPSPDPVLILVAGGSQADGPLYRVAYPGSPQQSPSEEPHTTNRDDYRQPRRYQVQAVRESREQDGQGHRLSDKICVANRSSIWLPGPPTGWPAVTRGPVTGAVDGLSRSCGPGPRRPAADPLAAPHSPRGPQPHCCHVSNATTIARVMTSAAALAASQKFS